MEFDLGKRYAGVIGTGICLPDRILTNFDLEKMVDTSDEWIRTRTGIVERRIADPDTPTSSLAIKAALEAISDAGISPLDLDMIIVPTVTPDMFFPSTACLVQKAIGAKRAASFDLSAACSGYIYGLEIARRFILGGSSGKVLVVAADTLSKITDWTDRGTCILLSDGAGAAVLGEVEEGLCLIDSYLASDGSYADILDIPGGGSRHPPTHETIDRRLHYLKMKGKEVFRVAVRVMIEAVERVIEQVGLKIEDVSLLIPHQANIRIIWKMAEILKISRDRIFINIERYGNNSAASNAICLHEAIKDGRIGRGDVVVMTSAGAGFTWGSVVFKWI
jgi:3-oxoacyl-[acyl-carrier-protein] synthase-3